MADNKKKKTDFSTGLKAAAEKLRPKREDVVTVMIGGVPTPIARADMDDATWENVVKQSVKTVPSKVDGSPEVGAEAEASVLHEQAKAPRGGEAPVEDIKKSIDWPQLMSLGQNLDHIDKSLVSDEEKGHLKGMSEWSRAEFLRERMRKHGYEVPKTNAEAERESFKKEATADNESVEKPGATDEKEPSQRGTGTQTEDDVHVGAADVPRPGSVRGMMSSFEKDTALGALPPPAKSNADYVKEYQTSKMVVPQEATEVADAARARAAAQKLAPMEGGFPAKFAGQGAPEGWLSGARRRRRRCRAGERERGAARRGGPRDAA
jgi:hypothetical protein